MGKKKIQKKRKAVPKKDRRNMMTGIIIAAVISLIIAVIGLEWKFVKKYVPFFPRPLILIKYTKGDNHIAIQFMNDGTAPADYFTADIRSERGTFSIGKIFSDFELTVSGEGGSWTVISGKDILPEQKGVVNLVPNDEELHLEEPKIKSDSRYKFLDLQELTWGSEEKREDVVKK